MHAVNLPLCIRPLGAPAAEGCGVDRPDSAGLLAAGGVWAPDVAEPPPLELPQATIPRDSPPSAARAHRRWIADAGRRDVEVGWWPVMTFREAEIQSIAAPSEVAIANYEGSRKSLCDTRFIAW
jgi:hypothetical protein